MPTRRGSQDRRINRATRSAESPKPATAPAKPVRIADAELAAEPQVRAGDAPERKHPRRNPLFPVGVNYHPINSEADGWEDWYAHDFAADFKRLAEARLSMVRVFLSWKLLEPQVGQYDEDAFERFAEVLSSARENRLQVIVCLFGDDRHSELVDVVWAKKRDMRNDPYVVSRQVALVQKVVNRFRGESAVFAWELANEAFLLGFTTAEELETWAAALREAIREIDPSRPVTLGLDPETYFARTGVDPAGALDACEFAVTHPTPEYWAYAALGPASGGLGSYLDSFLLKAASKGVPVLMDDAGPYSLEGSPIDENVMVRTALAAGFMNRGAGVLLRRYKDLATERREPYFRDPFESLVGIADADGRAKTTFAEVESFVKLAARIDLRRYRLTPERAAIMMPAGRWRPLPDLTRLYAPRACLQAYAGLKEAHVPVAVIREGEDIRAYSMLVIPSVSSLEDSTWEALTDFVNSGGTLALSYGGGEAHPAMRDMFGIEFLGDGGARDSLTCRVAQTGVFGALRSFDVNLEVPHFALLGGADASVVATDAKGSPLVTMNQYGQGRAVYIAAPIEMALAQVGTWMAPSALRGMLREIYGALAHQAVCALPLSCDAPQVEIALFAGDEDDILMLFNHDSKKVVAEVTLERPVQGIADVRGKVAVPVGSAVFGVPLEAHGMKAIRLVYP